MEEVHARCDARVARCQRIVTDRANIIVVVDLLLRGQRQLPNMVPGGFTIAENLPAASEILDDVQVRMNSEHERA